MSCSSRKEYNAVSSGKDAELCRCKANSFPPTRRVLTPPRRGHQMRALPATLSVVNPRRGNFNAYTQSEAKRAKQLTLNSFDTKARLHLNVVFWQRSSSDVAFPPLCLPTHGLLIAGSSPSPSSMRIVKTLRHTSVGKAFFGGRLGRRGTSLKTPAKRANRRGRKKMVSSSSPSRTCGSGGCEMALFQKKLKVLETAVAAVAVAAVAIVEERMQAKRRCHRVQFAEATA